MMSGHCPHCGQTGGCDCRMAEGVLYGNTHTFVPQLNRDGESDPYELANQLQGWIGPETEQRDLEWMLRMSERAAAMGDELRRLRTLEARLDDSDANGWQPIETAPKNKPVIGFSQIDDHNVTRILCWDEDDGGWFSQPGAYQYEPTHWRPLPVPPAIKRTPDEQ